MARRSFSGELFVPAVTLLLVALLAQLPSTTGACGSPINMIFNCLLPVAELVLSLNSKEGGLLANMFNLGGTKEISGVTILVPRQDAISAAAALYPAHENTTRTYSQAIADALKLMNQGETSGTKWTADQSPPGVAKVLSDIWNFQIVQKYIPPFVAMQEYSSGGPFELKSKQGESLWMTYVPTPYGGAMNISGMSPEQRAGSPLPNVNGSVHLDGSPFAYTMLDFGDVIVDNVDSKVVVYRSDAVLLPLKMDPLGAYVGATASIFHLFASFGIALAALMLM